MSDRKELILDRIKAIPVKNIVNYIVKGEISLTDVVAAMGGAAPEKLQNVCASLRDYDDTAWRNACDERSYQGYEKYLAAFPQGQHAAECKGAMESMDDKAWDSVLNDASGDLADAYLERYPNGRHAAECLVFKSVKLPWLRIKKNPSVAALTDFIDGNPHGPYADEARQMLADLSDEEDWRRAQSVNSTDGFKRYLEHHPKGRHVDAANNAIWGNADRDRILSDLRADKNAFGAEDIQKNVSDNKISWADLAEVFSDEQIAAIRNYSKTAELPTAERPTELQADTTEVYFWGTPASGKTCAIGAILSGMEKLGSIEKQRCKGLAYMTRLGNLFSEDGVCTLPGRTYDDMIYEMVLSTTDVKGRSHDLTLVDLSGELFRIVYAKDDNAQKVPVQKLAVLADVERYLASDKNKKIHFFFLPYGENKKVWDDGVLMKDYCEAMVRYLKDGDNLKKETNAIYIVVTKSDSMHLKSTEERDKEAARYVKDEYKALFNNLRAICEKHSIKDFGIMSFNVGEVFAKRLCLYDPTDANAIIKKLWLKSKSKGGWFGNFLRS